MDAIEHGITIEQYARTLAQIRRGAESETTSVVQSRLDIDLPTWEVVSHAWKARLLRENQSDDNDNLIAFARFYRDELTSPTRAVTVDEPPSQREVVAPPHSGSVTRQAACGTSPEERSPKGAPHETAAIDPAAVAALCLPFQGVRPAPPTLDTRSPDAGETSAIDPAAIQQLITSLPFSSQGPTSPPSAPKPSSANSHETTTSSSANHPHAGETQAVDPRAIAALAQAVGWKGGSTSPQPTPPAGIAGSGSLTLERYAAVETEIRLYPEGTAGTLARYGLTPASRERHASALRGLLHSSPDMTQRWRRACHAYEQWRLSTQR